MKYSRNKLIAFCGLIFSFTQMSASYALPPATGSGVLRNVQPGAVLNIDRPQRLEDKLKQKKRPKEDLIKEEEAAPAETPQDDKEGKIILKEINLEDDTLLSPFMVEKITSKYLNKEIGFGELQELTHELTALYREKGYVTSRVYLPPQKIKDGVLTLQSSEGIIKPITLATVRTV